MRRHTTAGVICTIEDVVTSPTAWSCTLVATVTLTSHGSGGHWSPDDYDEAECKCAVRGEWTDEGEADARWHDSWDGPDDIDPEQEAARLVGAAHACDP